MTGESDDFGDCEFGYGSRIGEGGVEDGNSELSSGFEVDLVCANAEAADDCEILCRVEYAGCKLGFRTNTEDLDIPVNG